MKRMFPLVAAVLIAVAAQPASAITFGESDDGRHPQTGAMVVEFEDGTMDWICSGALIAPTVFLTASHCTEDFDRVWVTFAADADDGIADGDLHAGTAITHPEWGGARYDDPHDIAVILLDEPTGIEPADLAPLGTIDSWTKQELRSRRFVAVGYGGERESFSGGILPVYNGERRLAYQSAHNANSVWLDLAMTPSNGNGGTCYGDSGGPHFIADTNVIVSITVTGDVPCKALDKTYRVDTAEARAFLDRFVEHG